jgi:hypothetical protein
VRTGERISVQTSSRPLAAREGARREGAQPDAEPDAGRQPEPARLERIALAAIATDAVPLRPDLRADMEARLGADFGSVRVHSGSAAARAARELEAEAFTVGEDVVFAEGMYVPDDAAGRHRLAHELAHVLQQRRGAAQSASWGLSRPGDALEQDAELAAHQATAAPAAPAAAAAPASASPAASARTSISTPVSASGERPAPASATSAPSGPGAPAQPRVIQRRALLSLSPSREAASDAAAESPWLGTTAPGMLDFSDKTPVLTPRPDSPTRDQAAAASAPDRAEPTRAPGSALDSMAEPEREPVAPAPTPPSPAETDHEAPARAAAEVDARAIAETKAAFPNQSAGQRQAPADLTPPAADMQEESAAAPGRNPAAPATAPPGGTLRQRAAGPQTVALPLPRFPDETAEEFAALITADRDGQLRLQSAVSRALTDIAAHMDRENARVDAGVKSAEDTITASIKQARGRVQGAAASARSRAERARREQGERAGRQLTTKKSAVPADVEKIASDVEDVGRRKADAAQQIADNAASELEASRDNDLRTARTRGDDHAARASSYAEEPEIQRASIGAQQQAAHDVAEQTAKSIDDAIRASTRDLRGGGPELHRAVGEQLSPVARDVRRQIEPMQQAMTAAGTQLDTTLDGAVSNARTTIEQTARGLMDALAGIDRQTKHQLRTAADTTKAGLKRAQAEGEQQLRGKVDQFVTAAHTELGQHLTLISSRPVRRMLARRLANELKSILRNGYGAGAAQANQLAGRVAGQLSSALAQFHQELTAATQPATSGAQSTAESAGRQLGQTERLVVDFLSKTVTDTLTRLDASQSERIGHLGETVGVVDERLTPFVDQTRQRIDGDKSKLLDDAREKLGTLDSRIDQAMTKAREKAELGAFGAWLLDQLRSLGKALITPSFWVGLLVGLLITIFIVATFGGGAMVLLVAGVVAGAISAAAAYTAQVYLDPLLDSSAPHKEFSAKELGYQMLIGGIAGGVGAAAGGLANAGVNAIVTNVAQRVAVNKVAQTVVGAALGVVQNCMTGPDGGVHWQFNTEHWDEGLLTNVAVSTAMSSRRVEKRIQGIQERARGTMVDRGLARNVTAEERAQSQARFERAGAGAAQPVPAPRRTAVPNLSDVHVEAPPVAPPVPAESHPPVTAPAEPHPPLPVEQHPPVAPEPHPASPPAPEHPTPATPQVPERERAAARAPEREGGAPPAPHEVQPAHERPVAELTDMVMSTDEHMDEAAARHMYENARRDEPHTEFAVLRNSETGEHIVIQGDRAGVKHHESLNSSLRKFLEDRPGTSGRWELVEHSHAVDPARGVTHEAQRFPSGNNGDFQVAREESMARGGAPVEQKIGIVTERGNETVHYGYDPSQERPYSLTRPGPDGTPVTERFRSMEAYGEWYERQPGTGGGSPHLDDRSPTPAAPRRGGAKKRTPPPLPGTEERAAPVGKRDKQGRMRAPDGTYATDPETHLRRDIVFPAEREESRPHAISSARAEEYEAQLARRQEAQRRSTAAHVRQESVLKARGLDPQEFRSRATRRRELNRLRMEGVSRQERGELLHAERSRAREQRRLSRQSERLGMLAGQDVLESGGLTRISGEVDARGRPHEADLIGVSPDGDRLHVIEAKGGSADLGEGRFLEEHGGRAEQGSPEYLNDVLNADRRFQRYLADHPEFAERLRAGKVKVEYSLVHAAEDGRVTVTPLRMDVTRGTPLRDTPRTMVGGAGHDLAIPLPAGERARNAQTKIGGRIYSGAALDQMQSRGFVPSVVENTISTGTRKPGPNPGTTSFHDPVNKVTVVIDDATNRVLSAVRGSE